MMKILICGNGNIGKHLEKELSTNKNIDIKIYDKYKNSNNSVGLDYLKFDFMFVCVPTEKLEDGRADTSEVEDCISKFSNQCDTIIIKSAVPVGTAEKIGRKNVIISPEYWGTTQHCPEPNFLILGGEREYRDKVVQLYNTIKNGYYKYYFTDWKTAELVKYMENSWIATKVTFCNEFNKIAKAYGISYAELRELWLADSRVSPSHTLIYDDAPDFSNSHCLSKDVPALIKMCEDNELEVPLLKSL